ncbi:Gfo/Idh/MocA family protein [Paenibacillus thalictri]|uniref:Gfo/Idh/MocA family oxidoreductase n=1 Tax=Paenibacillus thalictri TaxID=2527873 RepID=A0A4Q9DVC2_9BACL|nr:Gfo/Idh/MocA family oxidoreductase [Paenibacillus thalictri]TBL80315.1 Gfo/Idh/MocA family oxidoreductase [Paenibacillus thalictri]
MSERKLRFGVLGCAGIAKRAVIPGIQQSELCEAAAIASRDEEKAKLTAEQVGIPVAYGSYEALLADETIDAVYIPLPNHLHKEWTIKAAEAGKHVLCEKPAALDAAETEEMVAACAKAGVTYAEAFMYRHHPRYAMIREIIDSGEIGQIRGIHGAFTFNGAANQGNVRFAQWMGGGSIYDVGVYPLSAARLILGREPEAVTVNAFFSPEHDHVDMMASGLVEFSDSVALTFDCGMWAAGRNTLEILGTDGIIEVPSAYVSPLNASSNFFVTVKGERREVEVPQVNQYALQADDFARSVFYGEPQKFDPQDSIKNMRVVDACLKSARERVRVII